MNPDQSDARGDIDERSDLSAATSGMNSQRGAKRELRQVAEYLDPEEQVLRLATGNRGSKSGLLVLTDRRLMFLWKGLVRENHESIPLDLITSVALKRGLATSTIKTQGAQAKEEIQKVNKKDAEALVMELRDLLNRRSGRGAGDRLISIASDAEPDREDVLAQVKQLKGLLEIGAISDEEYEAKKSDLLSRL
jgi:hypothetical protein